MVVEMSRAETCQQSPVQRKRELKEEKSYTSSAGTQTEEVPAKKAAPNKPTNNGWGDLFKNKETFVEMHIC